MTNSPEDMYQEYCSMMQQMPARPTAPELKANLAKFRQEYHQKTLESGRHFIDCRHKEYDQRLAQIALDKCKSRKEWQDMEADYKCVPDWLVITHISAQEALELYNDKVNRSYKAEQWYMSEIRKCEQALLDISQSAESEKRKYNKTEHWQARKQNYLIKLHVQVAKTHKLEALVMKWRGVREKIRIADIAKEIKAERAGKGNKYGFNPNMQDRASATGVFTDY